MSSGVTARATRGRQAVPLEWLRSVDQSTLKRPNQFHLSRVVDGRKRKGRTAEAPLFGREVDLAARREAPTKSAIHHLFFVYPLTPVERSRQILMRFMIRSPAKVVQASHPEHAILGRVGVLAAPSAGVVL